MKFKKIENGRLLKNYGSWMYCSSCDKTVGYLCYSTYQYFKFEFKCNCNSSGYFELGEKTNKNISTDHLMLKKNRLCCPNDESPLFSIVNKNINSYKYAVQCSNCNTIYESK